MIIAGIHVKQMTKRNLEIICETTRPDGKFAAEVAACRAELAERQAARVDASTKAIHGAAWPYGSSVQPLARRVR